MGPPAMATNREKFKGGRKIRRRARGSHGASQGNRLDECEMEQEHSANGGVTSTQTLRER